jgi:hypothetical protein
MEFLRIWYVMFIKVGRKVIKNFDDDQLSYFAMVMTIFANGKWIFLATLVINHYFLQFSIEAIRVFILIAVFLNTLIYFILYDYGNRWKEIEVKIDKRLEPQQRNRIFFKTLMFYYISIMVLYAIFFYDLVPSS